MRKSFASALRDIVQLILCYRHLLRCLCPLHGCFLHCRYIIGLPLWQKNAVDMSRHIIEQAQTHLADSLMGFELGNEVSTTLISLSQMQQL
jgi:hypothetical protein